MAHLIDKDALVAEIESKRKYAQSLGDNAINSSMQQFYDGMKQACVDTLSLIDTLEVKDPYERCVQYDSIKAGIQAHAETYSFNIESQLFPQLTKEQQQLWRKEIEQAVISGGDAGVTLVRDQRYKDALEVEVDSESIDEKAINKYLYEKKGYPIDLNGNLPSFEETMKDVEKYNKYKEDKFIEKTEKWLNEHILDYVYAKEWGQGVGVEGELFEDFKNYLMKGM